jgi:hypothetical protein
LLIEEHLCVPGRVAATGGGDTRRERSEGRSGEPRRRCRCQTLTIFRLNLRHGAAGLRVVVEEWGKEGGARQLVVEKIEKVSDYDRVEKVSDADLAEVKRILDSFTPYEEDEDEIVGMKPAATRVPYDDE